MCTATWRCTRITWAIATEQSSPKAGIHSKKGRKKTAAPAAVFQDAQASDATLVLAGTGINFNLVTLPHKQRHGNFKTSRDFRRLEHLA